MGRFPNIAAAKAKTGAAKGKLYGMYAKEIYLAAKNGGVTPEGNPSLKRLIDKAKKDRIKYCFKVFFLTHHCFK